MRAIVAAFAGMLLPAIGYAQATLISGSEFGFGNWQGSAYHYAESGKFSHCAISAPYVSGDTLFFSITDAATVNVGISSPALSLPQGHQIPVAIYVDRRQPIYGRAIVRGDNFATLEIADFNRALEHFKRGYGMVVEGGGLRGEYNLNGTFRAIDMATDCAVYYSQYYAGTTDVPQANDYIADIDPAISFQLAAEMIVNLGLTDARFLTTDELRALQLEGSVYWISNSTGVSGGVMFFNRPPDFDVREVDTASTSYLSRDCDGDIANSIRSVPGEVPMRQIRVLCASPKNEYEAFLTNASVGGLQLVTIMRFDSGGNFELPAPRMELSEKISIQNATYVLEME